MWTAHPSTPLVDATSKVPWERSSGCSIPGFIDVQPAAICMQALTV